MKGKVRILSLMRPSPVAYREYGPEPQIGVHRSSKHSKAGRRKPKRKARK
jgi:hypothetical protein